MGLGQVSISFIIFAIVILCFIEKLTLKINVKWINIAIFGVAVFFLLIGFTLFVSQHFIAFSSPESAYRLVYGGETFVVVEGNESDYVIGDKDAKYLNKTKKGWKVPIINASFTKGMKRVGSTTIYVSRYNFSDEYYLTVLDSANNNLEIKDNRNSTFYKRNNTNNNPNKKSCVYYAYINKINNDYVITVNGEDIKLLE